MGSQSRTQMRDWTELKINLICLLATLVQFSYVQLLSRVRLFATPWIAAHQASLSITNSRSSPKPMSIELVMPSSHLILCRSLLLLPPIPPSIRVFSNESTLRMRWPKYWSLASVLPNSLFNFLSIWLDIKNLLLVSRWKHGSVWVLGFVWCPMRQLWHWSVQSFKCSFKGSRDLQIPRIQWPLTYLNLQFILFLISKKFPYFFCHWTGISKICNYLVFSLAIFSWYFSYITKWRLWHLISLLKDALFRTLFSKCHLKLCAIKLLFFIY